MNLRDLLYLVAIDEHRHFGRAAAACHASQPTLSAQIKKLEEELGVSLLERPSKRAMLTPVGDAIVAKARRLLAEAEDIREIARRARDPHTGTWRLGAFPTLAPYVLPIIVPRIHASMPGLTLLLTEEKSDELLRRLREGRLDAVLLALPVEDAGLIAEPVFDEAFSLATPINHPLARKKFADLDDLRSEELMLLDDGHCLRAQVLDVCHLSGAREKPGFRATSLETLRQMVAAGVGVTLLPALAIAGSPQAHVAIRPFHHDAPRRTIALVWRRSSPFGDFHRELARLISAEVAVTLSAVLPASARKSARRRR